MNNLENVYFILGRGKTTIANILRDRYGFYVYRTDEARDRLMLVATPEKQPYMCRDFEAEYGVSSFWELPSEVIADREIHFLGEMTPMIIDELAELSKKHSVIICEGDIDYKQIIGLTDNIVYLQNCGTKFDWFNRPDHDNLDYIRNRTDIDETQKQALIDQAYASVGNNESVLPDYVIENKLKVISWDDSIMPEETATEVEGIFGIGKEKRYKAMIKVSFDELGTIDEKEFKFAVICAKYSEKWIFCRHKERATWEIPGGHREIDEAIEETARRELIEETGAKEFNITPLTVYCVEKDGEKTYGVLFLAKVTELGDISIDSEIKEIALFDNIPVELTYPKIQPYLYEYVQELTK